jgi:hypothetical protein
LISLSEIAGPRGPEADILDDAIVAATQVGSGQK